MVKGAIQYVSQKGDEVGENNKRCLLMTSFEEKETGSEAERAFDCYSLAPVKE